MTNIIINNKEKWLHIVNSNLNRKYEYVSMRSEKGYTIFKCKQQDEDVFISVYDNKIILIQIG